ncbi:hypothetical protein P59_256 [Bacillus phage P59]|nr:hypothetical protein P59_027 [Bacillus phage P59]QIW88853.1 hypothetical protein P59_256 [Bacillus phage P59]
MTKKESMDEIIYNLKMSGNADFEIDNHESFASGELQAGGFYIESQFRYMEVKNLTEARKVISKLGQKILVL